VLGISLASFQIAGGLLLFYLAFEMIFGQRQTRKEERAKHHEGGHPEVDDVSVFPMGTPMIAGPGAIASVMLYVSRADDATERYINGQHVVGERDRQESQRQRDRPLKDMQKRHRRHRERAAPAGRPGRRARGGMDASQRGSVRRRLSSAREGRSGGSRPVGGRRQPSSRAALQFRRAARRSGETTSTVWNATWPRPG